jgi:hypothetical protein
MKARYRLFLRRGRIYYAFDSQTGRHQSLGTRDQTHARRLVQAMNDAHNQPAMNLQLARVYLQPSDPEMAQRTWQSVMDEIIVTKRRVTQDRWNLAARDQPKILRLLRSRTTARWSQPFWVSI